MKTIEESFKAKKKKKKKIKIFLKIEKLKKFVKTVLPSEKRNIIYVTILVKLKIRKN